SEEPVTCGVHLRSPVASQQAPDSRMVPLDDLSPTMVTELRVHRGRADDVREQDRREGSIELRLLRSDRIDEPCHWRDDVRRIPEVRLFIDAAHSFDPRGWDEGPQVLHLIC